MRRINCMLKHDSKFSACRENREELYYTVDLLHAVGLRNPTRMIDIQRPDSLDDTAKTR